MQLCNVISLKVSSSIFYGNYYFALLSQLCLVLYLISLPLHCIDNAVKTQSADECRDGGRKTPKTAAVYSFSIVISINQTVGFTPLHVAVTFYQQKQLQIEILPSETGKKCKVVSFYELCVFSGSFLARCSIATHCSLVVVS